MPLNTKPLRSFVAAIVTLSPLIASRAKSSDPTAYISKHSVAALTLRVADTVRLPFAKYYPVEVLAAASEDFLGLPLNAIERVTLVVEPPMGITPQYVVVLDSSVPITLENFRQELIKHTTVTALLGRPSLESSDDRLPSYCLIDERTLLVGPRLYLKRLLRSDEPPSGDLFDAMQSDGGGTNHLHFAITLKPVKPLMEVGLEKELQDATPPERAILESLPLIDRIIAGINLSGDRQSMITIHADDAEAADQLELQMADWLFAVRQEMKSDPKMAEIRNHPEATFRAWWAYLERMFDSQAERLSTLREDETTFVVTRFEAGNSNSSLGAVAVTGILVALLLPAVQAAREAARRAKSTNNLKQILLALLNYESANGHFPPQAIHADDGTPLLSWRVAILPYLEEQDLFDRFKLDEPWDSPHNAALLPEMPAVYHDPSSAAEPTDGKTDYLGVAGPRAIFDTSTEGVKLAAVTDGLSMTIAVV
ncbi:MAG: DUF1559 domain-containing protein [Planctomycetota bacterium]